MTVSGFARNKSGTKDIERLWFFGLQLLTRKVQPCHFCQLGAAVTHRYGRRFPKGNVLLVGYARVSTKLQETHLQLDALRRAGVQRIHQEKTSSVGPRPALQQVIASLGPGDVLVVYKIDRVARSLKDLLSILDRIIASGAAIRSLTEPLDTSSPLGMFMLQILGAVAQLERSMIRERCIAGQVAAFNRGVRWGGQPLALQGEDLAEMLRLRKTGYFSLAMLADIFGCSVSTVIRASRRVQNPGLAEARRLPVLGKYLGA